MKNNKSNYKIINNHVEKNRTILRNKKGDIVKYSDLLDCNHNYDKFLLNEKFRNNYSIEADKSLQRKNFVRGVLVYYPADQHEYFEQEFRWFYRSWIEMLKNEPSEWRTDLIVFINMKVYKSTNMKFFEQLNCFETNMRFTKDEFPMCTLLNYVELRNRQIPLYDSTYFFNTSAEELYNYFYKKVNVFDNSAENLWRFYGKLKELKKYQYLDSILMVFDGYNYFKNNFDFLMRSDMDVFLTPLFAKWLPLNCNDFITGSGGYSHDFNMKRIRKAANLMNLKFGEIRNLGSTWYSTPAQFRLVSYLTLVSMAYINSEEFSEPERQARVGTILWPGNIFKT